MAFKADVQFLVRLKKNIMWIFEDQHWDSKNLQDDLRELRNKLDVCIDMYERGNITEKECVRMMYWQFN